MINRKLIFFILVTLALNCQGQVMPAPGAKLNYNQVMFEYEKVKEAGIYLVQVAAVSYTHLLTAYRMYSQTKLLSA